LHAVVFAQCSPATAAPTDTCKQMPLAK